MSGVILQNIICTFSYSYGSRFIVEGRIMNCFFIFDYYFVNDFPLHNHTTPHIYIFTANVVKSDRCVFDLRDTILKVYLSDKPNTVQIFICFGTKDSALHISGGGGMVDVIHVQTKLLFLKYFL